MTNQIARTRDSDPRRMRLRFHYEVDSLGKHIAVWSEESEEGVLVAGDRRVTERHSG